MFVPGAQYRRQDLHDRFGGQSQGGISTPADHPLVLLFTGEGGEEHGYRDRWTPEGIFLYSGEGQVGDMEFKGGNRAIRDHAEAGEDLHLFEQLGDGLVRYLGQMVCTGHHLEEGPDREGHQRQQIIFELTPMERFGEIADGDEPDLESFWSESLEELRRKALEQSTEAATPAERLRRSYERSEAIRIYVLRRAGGVCEGCTNPAPFQTRSGRPYLETHHVRRISDHGPDHPAYVVAVCPTCHRRAHYGQGGETYNARLQENALRLEREG